MTFANLDNEITPVPWSRHRVGLLPDLHECNLIANGAACTLSRENARPVALVILKLTNDEGPGKIHDVMVAWHARPSASPSLGQYRFGCAISALQMLCSNVRLANQLLDSVGLVRGHSHRRYTLDKRGPWPEARNPRGDD
jgi:hypothetical protein